MTRLAMSTVLVLFVGLAAAEPQAPGRWVKLAALHSESHDAFEIADR
jgi:hypothetical protein